MSGDDKADGSGAHFALPVRGLRARCRTKRRAQGEPLACSVTEANPPQAALIRHYSLRDRRDGQG
jgi:hypothetical protein